VRGEKSRASAVSLRFVGSSPRAWGKGEISTAHLPELRIIPTCVGKSAVSSSTRAQTLDHPHVRGEKRAAG